MFPELGRRGCPTGIMIIEKAATAKIIQNGEAEILELSMASWLNDAEFLKRERG